MTVDLLEAIMESAETYYQAIKPQRNHRTIKNKTCRCTKKHRKEIKQGNRGIGSYNYSTAANANHTD